MKTFIGIACMAKNRVIGKEGKLPWDREGDLSFFKKTTLNGNVIFGRKTYENLGIKYLPNRNIFVLSKTLDFGWTNAVYNGKYMQQSINHVIDPNDLPDNQTYYVAGGDEIYKLFLPEMKEFLVTVLNKEYEGDIFMPEFEKNFEKNEIILITEQYNVIKYYK